jgi:hypothetical protein
MATVTKDFKVKNGLIVEGTTGTINNHDILTKKTDDQTYIVNLIGGTATSANEGNKVVKRDANGDFAAGTITADLVGDVTGNADTATTLETARTISLTGDVTGSVSFDGSQNVSITATVDGSFATDAEVATAKSEAISAAATDATTKANNAKSGAEATAAAALASAVSTLEGQIADAETDANTYTNNAITALNLAGTYDALGAAAAAQTAANLYTDGKVADLVDGAPSLLNTLNELAEAIAENPNYATDVANLVAGKQDTLTAGSNIDITNDVISVTGLDTDDVSEGTNQYFTDARARNAFSAGAGIQIDGNGVVKTDISTGIEFKNGTSGPIRIARSTVDTWYDAAGAAATAEANAIAHADALDTDDIGEGASNLYHTSARAKTAAAELLTGATLQNIQITGNGSGLTITAENGVADSTTADLAEDPEGTGTSGTWYFTNARAVSALEAVTPDFPAVEIASVAKQVAASATVATASTNTAVSWDKADYRSAEFLVKIAEGSHTEVSKVILTLDASDNVAVTEYAMVGTNGNLGNVTADVNGSDVRLRVVTLNNNSTVSVVGTLLV